MSALHWDGIAATARRQFGGFLASPLGYIFILAFVLAAGAVLFWIDSGQTTWFARNIADLGPWLRADTFGWLLAGLLPALAMGTWAAERDHGTEEHLLTLPLSPLDALLGKWLAVAGFYSLALACTLSHVGVVAWLGPVDWGLVFANYLGWWLAGLAFAGLAVLASTLVSLPSIAFVVGAMLCGTAQWCFSFWDFYDGFERGVIGLGGIAVALATAAAALGAATFVLSSRRWRPGSEAAVALQVMSLCFAVVLAANLGRLGSRHGAHIDATAEGLSSVSAPSIAALRELKDTVTVTAFISSDLPPELALKGKEVEDKLKAIERAAPGKVELKIRNPVDGLDADSVAAETEFGLKPRRMAVDSASGRRMAEVFLGAAVTSAGRTQVIEHFDPGLSVEYELVRAIRSVSDAKKRVLGIATTDLEVMGGFDYRSMNMTPTWEIVGEWKRQYDVRGVSLDSEVAAEIEVLVVPQPSTLTQAQIERLHDYIWAGRPALLLEDPLPFFQVLQGRADLVPGQPKRNPNQGQFGMPPPEEGPRKGDLKPLMNALGLEWRPEGIPWSDFNPSPFFRELISQNFLWVTAQRGAIARSDVTTGVNAALLPFPGTLPTLSSKPAAISVAPLLMPATGAIWGMNQISDLTQQHWQGGLQFRPPQEAKRVPAADQAQRPALAVEITGTMASAWPRVAPGAKAEEGKDPPQPMTAAPSPKPVRVVVIADLDLIDNQFFQFYRDQGSQLRERDEMRALLELKNVQLVANAVDALFDDRAYLALRTHTKQPRPLQKLEDVSIRAQEDQRRNLEAFRAKIDAEIEQANTEFRARLDKIDAREDLDEDSKNHEKAIAQQSGERKVQVQINQLKQELAKKERELASAKDRAVRAYIWWVKFLAIAIPSAILAVIALAVFANRLVSEKTNIPASRRRQA